MHTYTLFISTHGITRLYSENKVDRFVEVHMRDKYTQQYKEIGLKIAYYRKLKGLSQLQLAEQIDVSRTHLSNIEAPNVPTSISLDLLFRISEVLGIEPKAFFEFTNK